jgi:hypothetical protein
MIDLRKAPRELFAQVLESNLQGIGPVRKLYGHFADAVLLRLGAECVWVMGGDGEVRADYMLCDFTRAAAFLCDERPPTAKSVCWRGCPSMGGRWRWWVVRSRSISPGIASS